MSKRNTSFLETLIGLIASVSWLVFIIGIPIMGVVYCIRLWKWLFPTKEEKRQRYLDSKNLESISIHKSKKSASELFGL